MSTKGPCCHVHVRRLEGSYRLKFRSIQSNYEDSISGLDFDHMIGKTYNDFSGGVTVAYVEC